MNKIVKYFILFSYEIGSLSNDFSTLQHCLQTKLPFIRIAAQYCLFSLNLNRYLYMKDLILIYSIKYLLNVVIFPTDVFLQ